VVSILSISLVSWAIAADDNSAVVSNESGKFGAKRIIYPYDDKCFLAISTSLSLI
jgi:hypothetical protein